LGTISSSAEATVPLVQRVEDVVGLADDGDLFQRVRADDQVNEQIHECFAGR
jgi:hypothetical protein